MTTEMRRIRTGLIAASLLAAMLCSVAGCGGSGSSGFDAVPSEASAIQHVIDAGDCTDFDGQTFCASGAKATGMFKGALVKIQDHPEPLVCDGNGDLGAIDEKCTVPLAFTTEGFDHPSSLLAAVSETEGGPWTLVNLATDESVTDGPRTVSIDVPARTDATVPTPLIAAVMVFDGQPPTDLPAVSAHLADFGVDLVYVSPRLQVVVPR
jgi:hypothetical protein